MPSSPASVEKPLRSWVSSRRSDLTSYLICVRRRWEGPAWRRTLPPLLEWMGITFTGSGSETLALCRRKPWMNAVLAAHGVAVPRAGIFPAIVKPADEDGSAGIHADSVCDDADAVQRARARWPGPVVVEEFVEGREFAVSLWGGTTPEYVSIGETLFRNGLRLNTYAAKWDAGSTEFADSPLDYTTEMGSSLREQRRGGSARRLARRRGSRLLANRHSLQRAGHARRAGRQSQSCHRAWNWHLSRGGGSRMDLGVFRTPAGGVGM